MLSPSRPHPRLDQLRVVASLTEEIRDLSHLRELVERFEDAGVDGVSVGDHLFGGSPSGPNGYEARSEPFTVLAAVLALSGRLEVGTLVANVGFEHPALLLRHFQQLAVLGGGARVLAGIGAGWQADEFRAIGLGAPMFRSRMERLEETLVLARQLWGTGRANFSGRQVVVEDLPLSPRPDVAPRLMVGGGSERLLVLAGRYADHVDLMGSSRRTVVGAQSSSLAEAGRRLATTVGDLEEANRAVDAAALTAGRNPRVIARSVYFDTIRIVDDAETAAMEASICMSQGVPRRALSQCPYVLVGSRDTILAKVKDRVDRLGLSAVFVQAPAAMTFCTDVLGRGA
jgi:alkanesulfonate monooxygenase SsuD/methylene tetrahydromethanopterin reductase-like flavin-dependent oxidoreductase (luciferase family)